MQVLESTATATPEPWVDLKAVSNHIGFGINTTRELVVKGKIPSTPMRNGKKTHWRFKLTEVDAAIKAGRTVCPPSYQQTKL